jgi:hypothetical protein
MLTAIICLLIGLFVGWNLPQPDWAYNLQEKVKDFFGSK